MKRLISKRFLSLALAIIMVAALIPGSAFAAGEDEPANYNYIFNMAAHGVTGANSALTSGNHSIDKMAGGSESSPWGFVNKCNFGIATLRSNQLNLGIGDTYKAGVVFAPGEDTEKVPGVRAAIAFEISASEGTYDAKLSVNPQTTATELEVYLVPKKEYAFPVYDDSDSESSFYAKVEAMSANYRIGKVDLYGENATNTDLYIGRVKLTADDYYLVLVPCGAHPDAVPNENGSWVMLPTGFKLDGVSENTAEQQDISDAISTAKRNHDENSSCRYFGIKTEENVMTVYNASVYRYNKTSDQGPLVVMKFTAEATGKYNLQLKTNADGISIREFAAAPLVSYAKYDGAFAEVMEKAHKDTVTNDTTEDDSIKTFKELDGYRGVIGYFNFSELTAADTYYNVKEDGTSSSENGVLNLEAGEEYFLAFSLDTYSSELSDKVVKVDAYTGGPRGDIALATTSANSNSQAFIISGINLVPVVDEHAAAYAADREIYEELTTVTAKNNTENTLAGYSSTATVTVVAQDIATGDSVAEDIVNENVAVNTEYTPVAPSVTDNYEFMYWAIGLGENRKIVSFDKDEYSFTVAPGRNMVYAVYRDKTATDKYAFFFDGSRTVLGKIKIDNNSVTLPSLPGAMPGFGNSTGWKYTGEEDETALSEGTVVENLTDDTFFVADYEGQKTVIVTIDEKTVPVEYGTEINLGDYASIREGGSGYEVFNYWKKGDEIISFKPDYSFKAYEDCILTSTYAKYEPLNKTVRRILLSADSETGITFAEFIGLGDAIEKGILFCDETATTYVDAKAKAVMQTDGNIFSVVNETEKTAIGYAILADGKIVYSDR